MPIGYSQEGYRPTAALANLATQGIAPIDVTRGGSIQYAPLAQIQVPSAQPELVTQGISSAMQSIGSGILSPIKAKWESEQALAIETAKQKTLLGQKAAEKRFDLEKELVKFDAEHSGDVDYEEKRTKFVEGIQNLEDRLPSSFSTKKPTPKPVEEPSLDRDFITPTPVSEVVESNLPKRPEKGMAAYFVDKADQTAAGALSALPVTQEAGKSTLSEIEPPQPAIIKEVDYNKSPRPQLPEVNKFKSDAEANAIAETLANKDWNAVVEKDKQGWNVIKLEDRYKDRIKEEETRALASKKEEREQAEFLLKKKKYSSEEETQKALSGMVPVKTTVKPGGEIQTEYKPQVPLKQQVQKAESALPQLDVMLKTINDIKKIAPKGGVIGFRGVGGEAAIKKHIPFTTAYDVDALLGNLKGNIAIKSLQEMRQNSPTGGALGNVSDKDLEMMQNLMGTLKQSVSPEIFYENLNSLQDRLEKTKSEIQGSVSEIKKGFVPIKSGAAEESIPLITSNEQFKALPSGATFKDPTGKIHTKK